MIKRILYMFLSVLGLIVILVVKTAKDITSQLDEEAKEMLEMISNEFGNLGIGSDLSIKIIYYSNLISNYSHLLITISACWIAVFFILATKTKSKGIAKEEQ